MGQVYSAFLLLYTLAMVPAGWLIDRFGARVTLIVFCFGSAVFVAGTSAVGLFSRTAASLWIGLIAVRSLMGLVNAPLHPAAARMVFAHVPPQCEIAGKRIGDIRSLCGNLGHVLRFRSADRLLRVGPRAFFVTGWITLVRRLELDLGNEKAVRFGRTFRV